MNALQTLSFNRALVTLLLGFMTLGGGGGEGGFCCLFFDEFGQVDLFCPGAEGGIDLDVGVTIKDLAFPGLPIVPNADDPDPKDMLVKRFKFPSETSPGIDDQGLSRRLVMRAKRDGAQHELSYDRRVRGSFESSIRVAVNPAALDGLVDGVSLGTLRFEQADGGGEGGPVSLSMTATWDAEAGGFVISAADQDGPLGTPVVMPGATDVVLQMSWQEFGRTLQALDPVELARRLLDGRTIEVSAKVRFVPEENGSPRPATPARTSGGSEDPDAT